MRQAAECLIAGFALSDQDPFQCSFSDSPFLFFFSNAPPFWGRWHYIVAHWFNDVFFYWTHRLFHSSAVYPVFHKKHHTYTGSISIAAEYAHPVESIVSNIFPTVLQHSTQTQQLTVSLCVVWRNAPVWSASFDLLHLAHATIGADIRGA